MASSTSTWPPRSRKGCRWRRSRRWPPGFPSSPPTCQGTATSSPATRRGCCVPAGERVRPGRGHRVPGGPAGAAAADGGGGAPASAGAFRGRVDGRANGGGVSTGRVREQEERAGDAGRRTRDGGAAVSRRGIGINASIIGESPTGLGRYAINLIQRPRRHAGRPLCLHLGAGVARPRSREDPPATRLGRPERGMSGHLMRLVWVQTALRAHAGGLDVLLQRGARGDRRQPHPADHRGPRPAAALLPGRVPAPAVLLPLARAPRPLSSRVIVARLREHPARRRPELRRRAGQGARGLPGLRPRKTMPRTARLGVQTPPEAPTSSTWATSCRTRTSCASSTPSPSSAAASR